MAAAEGLGSGSIWGNVGPWGKMTKQAATPCKITGNKFSREDVGLACSQLKFYP